MSKRSTEALWWSLFSAGGVMSAMFIPAIIIVTGFLLPFAGEDAPTAFARAHAAIGPWFVRLALFGVLLLTMIHCAHRIRHILIDLGFTGAPRLLATGCYGAAFAGAAVAGMLLMRIPA